MMSFNRCFKCATIVYDRGKGYLNFDDAYSLAFDTHSSRVIILIRWIFLDAHNANLVFVILAEFGHCLDFLFKYSHMLMLVKNGEENLVAGFSKRTRFLFLLWAAVVSLNKTYKWYAHVMGMKRVESFFLHLKCALLEVIERQNGDMHQLILHQFQQFSVLRFSVHIYVSTRFYLARIMIDSCQHIPSLTSEIYDSFMIQKGVRQFILSSLHLSSFSCYFSILGRGLSVHYLIPAPKVYSSCLLPVGIIMVTQIFLVEFQILKMLLWIGYLTWKFILVPPWLSSVTYVSGVANHFISVVCKLLQWECNWLSTGIQNVDIHLLVAIFSSQLDTSQKSTPSSFFIIIYAANFFRLFIFWVRIPPAVRGGEAFCVGISLRLFFLTLYLSTKELPPRVSIIFAKFLEFSSLFLFDRGKAITMYEHHTTQLVDVLGVEVLKGSTGKVFLFEANCLLMVVVPLMEHEWSPTKLQQNLQWQLHALSAQQCNPATTKVNDHVTSDMVPANLKQHLKRKLHVVPFQNYPSAPDTGNGREILQENLLTTSKILKTAYTKHYSAEAIAWGYFRWKFRLVSPGWWRVTNAGQSFISMEGLAENWNSMSYLFYQDTVLSLIAVTLMRSSLSSTSLLNVKKGNASIIGIFSLGHAQTAYLCCCRLLWRVFPPIHGCIQLDFSRGLLLVQFILLVIQNFSVLVLLVSLQREISVLLMGVWSASTVTWINMDFT
ncbi:hypothetical protein C5167_011487 [Papaver somniferum]|uniref:Uncharacterized protein n=1 Tax=Papaver somniferum TaxID=3469 RepID=A0A4Y7K4N9_PAPSO|nr:hypothetical protein C5167_011487 [Papaver somniferum]